MLNIKLKITIQRYRKGSYLPIILIASVLFLAFASALIGLAMANIKRSANQEKAVSNLNIAEAGVNYYMWHLSHDDKDYCDGSACTGVSPYGPYIHDYKNSQGEIIGTYSLYIKPPAQGEASVQVRSIGKALNSKSESIVVADIGMPSFARYSFVSNTECWFGENETTNGPVHSNVGVHFDGTSNGIVSASLKTYKPASSFGGDGQYHDGVWGKGGPKGFWVYPVPAVDFDKVSVDLNNLKIEAQKGGIYLDSSKSLGYYLKLNNNSIEVYKVTRERSSGISATLLSIKSAPQNGVIFVNDNVWIDGTYNGKLTVAASLSQGNQSARISIKDNLLYAAKDGSANIGLISEGDITVPEYAAANLEIDGALLAQNGHVWFPNVAGVVKNSISIYGSIASNLTWTWSYADSTGRIVSGYQTTAQTYDPYLTLSPPPQFPTTGSFVLLSWRQE